MSTIQIITAHAGDHYHVSLAKHYIGTELTSEQILDELKASSYKIKLNGQTIKFNAISLLGLVNGYRIALSDITNGLISGSHKFTKAKGLHRVH